MSKFYGNEISPYGKQYGKVDYQCLAKALNMVLCNHIMLEYCTEAELVNYPESEDGEELEEFDLINSVYQWYIIDDYSANILMRHTDEIVYEIPSLGIYVWGVTHYGTAWDYVLTDIDAE